jgi:hypothetical protein
VQSLRLLAQPRSNPASCGLRGMCRAKIADGKVGPHEGGMTALASGSGSSPVPSVSALIASTTVSITRTSITLTATSSSARLSESERKRSTCSMQSHSIV